ncbi:hypothetical protein PN465_04030 [Nodularia spumigena CS-584]|jgi:hypothetical protein|uniref:Uncharacterized protein n=2 Tax=Nodularia spumigena TaxID=70799 RepID=A0A2S0Q686_NODSP|nr:hypothetical protein [Nodularia spumigena]AHJ27918.1 hypothetical protein NSP_15840 [Nodularia spumigena CCY9414]AVZ29852.1 hypothetical protein BMF81_00799 [Nodularia spumigena UHCC 0039]MDB9381407.1 hypothetical protein [Nodularia spumigena CS-584]MEA5526447.1 hypothetical protein [Nodularia spumigena UHCC 0143]MEA5557133.1 hypothetical protein [Nodularia spumigena CH309]
MMTITPSIEEIKTMIFQLPVEELITLISAIEERLETLTIMQLAETGFQEWNDPEEDIYNAIPFS